jgi:hypothetical protein
LGYAEGGEIVSSNKRDRKESENGPDITRNPDGDAKDDEEDRRTRSVTRLENGRQNKVYGSPELRWREPQSRSYQESSSNAVLEGRDTGFVKKETGGTSGIYRESAIYDDEKPDPLGRLGK